MVHIFEYEKKLFVGDFVPAKDLLIMDALNFKVRMMSATDMHLITLHYRLQVFLNNMVEDYRKNRPP